MSGLLGMVVLIGLGFCFSKNRKAISWRAVGGGFLLQFLMALFVLFVPWGRIVLQGVSGVVGAIIGTGQEGIRFIFGPLGDRSLGFFFAFNVLPVIIFLAL